MTRSPTPTRPTNPPVPRRPRTRPRWFLPLVWMLTCALAGLLAANLYLSGSGAVHTHVLPPFPRQVNGAGTATEPTTATPTASQASATTAPATTPDAVSTATDAQGIPLATLGEACGGVLTTHRRHDAAGRLLVCDGRSWVVYTPAG